jgi:hypothetical protein
MSIVTFMLWYRTDGDALDDLRPCVAEATSAANLAPAKLNRLASTRHTETCSCPCPSRRTECRSTRQIDQTNKALGACLVRWPDGPAAPPSCNARVWYAWAVSQPGSRGAFHPSRHVSREMTSPSVFLGPGRVLVLTGDFGRFGGGRGWLAWARARMVKPPHDFRLR